MSVAQTLQEKENHEGEERGNLSLLYVTKGKYKLSTFHWFTRIFSECCLHRITFFL